MFQLTSLDFTTSHEAGFRCKPTIRKPNPHICKCRAQVTVCVNFMFNTLNSIQEIVLNKDDITARIYLADFALMMRMILENSTVEEIIDLRQKGKR